MSDLGDRLKLLRKGRRWTLQEVAKKLNLRGFSTYSNWEYGRTEPDSQMLSRLAELYETSVNYLINGEKEVSQYDQVPEDRKPEVDRLIEEALKMMPEEKKKAFLEMLKQLNNI